MPSDPLKGLQETVFSGQYLKPLLLNPVSTQVRGMGTRGAGKFQIDRKHLFEFLKFPALNGTAFSLNFRNLSKIYYLGISVAFDFPPKIVR